MIKLWRCGCGTLNEGEFVAGESTCNGCGFEMKNVKYVEEFYEARVV